MKIPEKSNLKKERVYFGSEVEDTVCHDRVVMAAAQFRP